jgi:outer membrane lipoprotein
MTHILSAILLLLLTACASGPGFPTQDVNLQLRAEQAAAPDNVGQRVLWGGLIIATHNLQDRSELEVLAYPLDNRQRPDTTEKPLGRFLAEKTGYLEPVDYAGGRLVTLTGTVGAAKAGKIQDSEYTYPVVNVTAIHLWPAGTAQDTEPQVRFGIGVIFH